MIFDLEIPSSNIELVYIPEGNAIPTGVSPLYYLTLDHKNKIPSDFITLERKDLIQDYAALGVDEISTQTFIPRGSKFNITNISKYSTSSNIKIPLFWKHVINKRVSDRTVKITDYFDVELDKDLYLVEELPDRTNIYVNKINNKILFIHYTTEEKTFKGLINLEPVFTEIEWSEIVISPSDVPENKYVQSDDEVMVAWTGTIYVKYDHEINLLRMPIANIEDNWYISILNSRFKKGIYNFSLPEYYIQNSTELSKFKQIKQKKCKILYDNYIQLPTDVDPNKQDKTDIFIFDFYTKELKHIITTDPSKKNKSIQNKYFLLAEDYSREGIIKLPIQLEENDIALADYWIIDNYYEFKLLNFNSDKVHKGSHFALFLKPDLLEGEQSVYYARIGELKDQNKEYVPGVQNLSFENLEEYQEFISINNLHHIAVITVSSRKQLDTIKFTDVRSEGGYLLEKRIACKSTADVLYNDLINNKITIPTNDTVIAYITPEKLIDNGMLKFDNESLAPTEKSKDYIEFIENKIKENMNISTKTIIQFEMGQQTIEIN